MKIDGWQPVPEHRTDAVSERAAGDLHDLLDRSGERPQHGDPLPLLWHWLAFLPRAAQSKLSVDGHPATGDFLPPMENRQRMYAGGSIRREADLRVGESIARASEVTDVQQKIGRSGELWFVTVDHRLAGEQGVVYDRNDIVYKAPAPPKIVPGSGGDASEGWDAARTVTIDPTLLFRFSALTYNAHRIHYDREYATGIEGYPGLVVHGPLQAVLLADLVESSFADRHVAEFDFRSLAPAFDTAPLDVRLRRAAGPDEVELAVFSEGRQTMTASARFAEGSESS